MYTNIGGLGTNSYFKFQDEFCLQIPSLHSVLLTNIYWIPTVPGTGDISRWIKWRKIFVLSEPILLEEETSNKQTKY